MPLFLGFAMDTVMCSVYVINIDFIIQEHIERKLNCLGHYFFHTSGRSSLGHPPGARVKLLIKFVTPRLFPTDLKVVWLRTSEQHLAASLIM